MESAQQVSPWRGYVNQLTYGLDLKRRVDDEAVSWLADALIEQRIFGHRVETYYEAATAALASGESTAQEVGEEDAARDLLARLLRELDSRRPWPEPPYRTHGSDQWANLATAPVIGHIPMQRRRVEAQLNGVFRSMPAAGGGQIDVLVVSLRSGELVGLVAPESFTERSVTVCAHGDPRTTATAIREYTGLDIAVD